MSEPKKNGSGDEQKAWLEHQQAKAQSENSAWFCENLNRLLQEHPEYWGKFMIVASRCSQPVLAVEEDHDLAYQKALASEELKQLAAAENLPPGLLILTFSLSDL